ncbi:MAG TPA: FKBP-type peptidyl-prolyl cis-trans isomerase [Bacteroidia bacterium]|jgi:FKBP-type peptidyl-prolyl cis-trans isomerase FkpA|nr:FKBP-type peptidyl-prolyl cis-trans isomerase [Bacteroidia bacterium]
MQIRHALSIACFAGIAFVACHKPEHPGYEKTASGIFVKPFVKGKDTARAHLGDRVVMQIVCKSEKDCTLIDTRKGNGHLPILIRPSVYPGDIFEAVASMHKGDSTGFIFGAKEYFQKLEHKAMPPFLDSTSQLYFYIKVDQIDPKSVVEAEQKKHMEEQAKREEAMKLEAAEAKDKEPEILKQYIADNKIKAKPTKSGLYYIETQKGTGENVKPGQTVSVKYTGKFLNGEVFDASDKHGGQPFDFAVGQKAVIPGWDEALLLMKKGGKATLIIPSALAYGDGGGQMKPYATLLFDVELVNVK